MRATLACERFRVRSGEMETEPNSGPQGAFEVPGPEGRTLWIIASDGRDWGEAALAGLAWEHVSVHAGRKRAQTPTWREMEYVRDLFWEEGDTVLQFSVPRAKHINLHDHVLHLWRQPGAEV